MEKYINTDDTKDRIEYLQRKSLKTTASKAKRKSQGEFGENINEDFFKK